MRLATARVHGTTRAVRIEGDALFDLGFPDVGDLLDRPDWRRLAESTAGLVFSAEGVGFAPLVRAPSKIVCVGLNYTKHIVEMGRDLPRYPTLFAKFADTLVGATDDILRPPETEAFDWEVELAVIIGTPVWRASSTEAEGAIAGFSILNDVTCRDWQYRTGEWLQGKNWQSTTPLGPALVTPDEVAGGLYPELGIRLTVDGETMQDDTTSDLLFGPVELVQYISTMVRLNPGDVIATGTPGGVGHARVPPRHLVGGERVVCEIDGLARLENRVVRQEA